MERRRETSGAEASASAILPEKCVGAVKRCAEETMEGPAAAKKQKKEAVMEVPQRKEEENKKKKRRGKNLKNVPAKSLLKKQGQHVGSPRKTSLLQSLMETVTSANMKPHSSVSRNGLANPAGIKRKDKSNAYKSKTDHHEHEKEVEMARSQTSGSRILYVGNLPFAAGRDDLREFFKNIGELVNVRVAKYRNGKCQGQPRGFCHVEFVSEEAAKKALELNGRELLGSSVKLDLARGRVGNASQKLSGLQVRQDLSGARVESASGSGCRKDDDSHQDGVNDVTQTVLVYGLDKSLKEDHIRSSLQEHFGSCGKITRVLIPKDYETGVPRGFAYIDFKGTASLAKALRLNNSSLGSYTLTVEEVGCSSVPRGGLVGGDGGSADACGGKVRGDQGCSDSCHGSGRVRKRRRKPNAWASSKGIKDQNLEPDQPRTIHRQATLPSRIQ